MRAWCPLDAAHSDLVCTLAQVVLPALSMCLFGAVDTLSSSPSLFVSPPSLPPLAAARLALGELLLCSGDTPGAVRALEASLSTARSLRAALHAGVAYMRLSEHARALGYFDGALVHTL